MNIILLARNGFFTYATMRNPDKSDKFIDLKQNENFPKSYADTNNRKLTTYSEVLAAIAAGFSVTSKDDYDNMAQQFPLYDALLDFVSRTTKRNC